VKLRRPGGLWLHRDFRSLWAAETISVFGTGISQLALPLVAVITLEASAFEVALLGVIEFAPFILISLPAGVWVDRMRRKPMLVIADLGRAFLLASIPAAYWLDILTIWQLYVVGFVVGILTVFFDVAYQSYLPSLVARDQLVEGNSKLEISRSAAQLTAPGLAGVLVEAIKAPGTVLVDAVSFALSAFYLFRIKAEEKAPTRAERDAGPGMKEEVKEGLRWVFGNRYLRWIAASTATFNFFGNIIFAVYLVYAVRTLGLRPGVIGLVFTVSSIGYLVGALSANRLSRRFGVGPTIIIGASGSVSLLLLAIAPASNPIPFLIAAQAISGMGVPIYNITQVSFRQAITPERIQGRMNSVMRFIVWGVMPLGSLLGGVLASWISLRFAIWVGAIGMSLAVLPVLLSPVRTLREMPEPVEEPLPSEAEAAGGLVPATAGTLPAAPPD
jgi:MFS family permease